MSAIRELETKRLDSEAGGGVVLGEGEGGSPSWAGEEQCSSLCREQSQHQLGSGNDSTVTVPHDNILLSSFGMSTYILDDIGACHPVSGVDSRTTEIAESVEGMALEAGAAP